ncbi:MAG: PAS domain S-box protein, partial [Povalibacter sp.]
MGVILVAYERESEQTALEKLLAPRGHRIVRANNGLEALDAARREPPHVVVSDIVLPRMDGFALCRKWKQDERLQAVPFIFYTRRHDDPKYERFALELGAERFLSRNEQPEALAKILDDLLAKVAEATGKSNSTVRMPKLEEGAPPRSEALERAQQALAMATERAQQAQARLRNQIGELEATNQRLASGEARFRRIFEANPLPMWIADQATGGFIAVNDTALETYGYGRGEFLALKSVSLSDGQTEEAGLTRHRRKDGSPIVGLLSSRAIEFDGRNADLVSICDLTERVGAYRKQIEQSKSDRSFIEALADGCWVIDADGHILDVNSAYCRLTGYSREELIKMSVGDIEQHGVGTGTARLKFVPSQPERYEVAHKRRDGSVMDAEVSVGHLQSSRGDAVLIIRDVSQRRREAALQRVEQRQLEFMVDLSRQAETLDESAVVRRMLEQAVDITNSPLAYLFFVQPADKSISLAAWRDHAKAHTSMVSAEPRSLNKVSL